ncbi:MAG: hypothetical protein AAFV93_02835 [Chloroflexota bacterium]
MLKLILPILLVLLTACRTNVELITETTVSSTPTLAPTSTPNRNPLATATPCTSPAINSASASKVQVNGVTHYPASPSVSYNLCVPSGYQAWIIVRTPGNEYYANGIGSNGSRNVNLGSAQNPECGNVFSIEVIIANEGTIGQGFIGMNPSSVTSRGLGSHPKRC